MKTTFATLVFLALEAITGAGTSAASSFPAVTSTWTRPAQITTPTTLYAHQSANNAIEISSTKVPGSQPLAQASFNPKAMETGWSHLTVKTDECDETDLVGSKPLDMTKAYAAGYLEGALMMEQIAQFQYNTEAESGILDDLHKSEEVLAVMTQQDAYVAQNDCSVDALRDADEETKAKCKYNHQAYLIHMQLHGILNGYNAVVPEGQPKLRMGDLLRLNADGAIGEYLQALYARSGSSFVEQPSTQLQNPLFPRGEDRPGRCSALAKLLKDDQGRFNDIYLGHSSWEDFSEMNRVWKVYDFPFCEVEAKQISFSSYPGAISSTDDFMITKETQLGIAETSLGGSGPDWGTAAYVNREKKHVPDYVHIMVATRLAKNGFEWMRHFSNPKNTILTGAYNSQWMLLDYELFRNRPDPAHLAPFTFMVLETSPVSSEWRDMTSTLQDQTFWASFNEPFFDSSQKAVGQTPDPQTYIRYPRYRVFAEQQKNVNSVEDMKQLMRRAKETEIINGEEQHIGYGQAICSRPDLNEFGMKHLVGCCDSKVVSSQMVTDMNVLAINGPSVVGNDKPFNFADHPKARHLGLPDEITWGWYFATEGGLEFAPKDWTPKPHEKELAQDSLPTTDAPVVTNTKSSATKTVKNVSKKRHGKTKTAATSLQPDEVGASPADQERPQEEQKPSPFHDQIGAPLEDDIDIASTGSTSSDKRRSTTSSSNHWPSVPLISTRSLWNFFVALVSFAVFLLVGVCIWQNKNKRGTSTGGIYGGAGANQPGGLMPSTMMNTPSGLTPKGGEPVPSSNRSNQRNKQPREMRFSEDGL
ncbi:unnamed protein product [Amoebophrya sp. A120]|nr:unnamed protein product [Amoebophrya sp. A120]|eukprot:GSA120T00008778001.1